MTRMGRVTKHRYGVSNCLGCQALRGTSAYHQASMPLPTEEAPWLPHSVSQPCNTGSTVHATVRACSEWRRDDPGCPTVFEDLDSVGLSRPGCLETSRSRTQNEETRSRTHTRPWATPLRGVETADNLRRVEQHRIQPRVGGVTVEVIARVG